MQTWLKSAAAVTTLAAAMAAAPVQAVEQGDWLARFGVASVQPNDDSGAVTGLAGSEVAVGNATSLGVTLTYMYRQNIGIELLGALPFEHDLKGGGTIDGVAVGKTKQLPPSLVGQYYFQPESNVRPYLGAGINYTTFFDEEADPQLEAALGGKTSISLDDSFGVALVAGVDVDINEDWFFNASAWYMNIETEATLNTGGTQRTVDVDIDPWAVMIGVGTSF